MDGLAPNHLSFLLFSFCDLTSHIVEAMSSKKMLSSLMHRFHYKIETEKSSQLMDIKSLLSG